MISWGNLTLICCRRLLFIKKLTNKNGGINRIYPAVFLWVNSTPVRTNSDCGAWGITYLGDDLYCHQPHCERVLAQHSHFIFTCKPDSHATLYEWVDDLTRQGDVQTVVLTRWDGKKRLTDTYRYVNQVPLRDSDDALMVNYHLMRFMFDGLQKKPPNTS